MNFGKNDIITLLSMFILMLIFVIVVPIKSQIDSLQSELTIYQNRPAPECPELSYENFLNHLGGIGNRDTAFTGFYVKRDVNHWVPGKTKVDTVTTKYEVHISVTEDSK